MQLVELGEHRVFAPAVEDKGVVAALADPLVLRPAGDGRLSVEEGAMGIDGSSHRTEPVEIEHALKLVEACSASR